MKQIEYIALMQSLGVVGALRFLQQFDIGQGDYTKDRDKLPEPTLEEFRQFTNINKSETAE